MPKRGYPESLNCWLKDFPRYLKLTCGPEMSNLAGPWSSGSVILLERIGFDDPDTSPVTDEVPPNIKVSYSDNGTDVGWIFKISMWGWATFVVPSTLSNYIILKENYFSIESTYFDTIEFRRVSFHETQIPKATSIASVTVPEKIIHVPSSVPSDPPTPKDPIPSAYGPESGLITGYWNLWGESRNKSSSFVGSETLDLSVSGFRQLDAAGSWGGYLIKYYVSGSTLKVTYSIVTVTDTGCVDIPENCSFDSEVIYAEIWTALYVNGVDRIDTLLEQA